MDRIIHQIWVGPHRMPSREQTFVEGIRRQHPTFQHLLWTDDNLPPMPESVRAVYDIFLRQRDWAHMADVLRVLLVHEFGGAYLDADLECRGGLCSPNLDFSAGFFCGHWGTDYTIPNTAFGAEKGNSVIRYLLDHISPACSWYGPSWMGDTTKKFYGLPRETDHDLLRTRLSNSGFQYVRWSEFESRNFLHHSLYSWSPENKARFDQGLMQ